MKTTELKPCPFCGVHIMVGEREVGGQKWLGFDHPPNGCFIQDGADVIFDNMPEAIVTWNTRAGEKP